MPKTWIYVQRTGELFDSDGELVATGYSGYTSLGKNNPSAQKVQGIGPIPVGEWQIAREYFNSIDHGPLVLRLSPVAGTETYGRGGFLIHGDSVRAPGTASRGCIVLARSAREHVYFENHAGRFDGRLHVVAEHVDLDAWLQAHPRAQAGAHA